MIECWRRAIAGLLGFGVLLGLAGCAGGTTAPAPSATPPPTVSPLPPRPAALKLDGVNPCELLSETQRSQLGLNPGEFKREDVSTHYPLCQWSSFPRQPDVGYLARLQLTQGAEIALDSSTGHKIVPVGGFTAVQTSAGGQDPDRHCILLVDVAPGQSLWAQFDNILNDYPGLTHEMSCQFARTFGEDLVRNLRAQAR